MRALRAEHTFGEGPRLGDVDKDALLAVANDVEHPAGGESDDRRTSGESFGADDPKVVFGREDEAARRGKERAKRGVVGASGEYDVLARHSLEGSALAAFAYDEQAQSDLVECAHRDVGTFVRGEPAHEKPEVTAFVVRSERSDVDRRVDDLDGAGRYAVIGLDPPPHRRRVRHPSIEAPRRFLVIVAQPAEQLAHEWHERLWDLLL